MKLQNSFEVSLSPSQAWQKLLDIPNVVRCMPGAELLEVTDPDSFKGKVSVKLGPVSLAFVGIARFVERDADQRTLKVSAQGADQKGRGGANAVVEVAMQPGTNDGTRVVLDTDLNLSGGVAQYGRGAGIIERVASQLIDQFARNFEAQLLKEREVEAQVRGSSVVTGAQVSPQPERIGAKPISGFSLVAAAFMSWLRGLFLSGAAK